MKYLHEIDASQANRLLVPTFANLAAFPSAASSEKSLAYADDSNKLYYSNGTTWVELGATTGAMTFVGGIAFDAAEPGSPATGDTYVFTTAGSNTWEGTNVVEIGDLAIWGGSAWTFVQNNIGAASETVAGYVELATSAEAITGSDAVRAVHPAGLMAALQQNRVTSVGGVGGAILTGDDIDVSFAVVHTGKGGQKPTIRETTAGNIVEVDWTYVSATEWNAIFAIAPSATPTYTITI
jgi:hypothetical protein